VTRRFAHGLQAQGSYTWGKSIDTGSSSIAGDTFGNSVSSLPLFDPRLRRGLSDFDIRHNFVLSYLWQIATPAGWNGPLAYAAKGWQLGGIFQASIKTECFAAPNPGTRLGNAGRNTIIGPGLENFDLSLFKNNPVRKISETFNAQLRFEFFNVLNHANFQVPVPGNRQLFNVNLASVSTAGLLTSTATTSRQIQIALKLIW